MKLTNGSEIRSVPASEGQIRGWPVDLLILDEAQLIPESLIVGAALPTTAASPEASIIMAGTAGRASGGFYDSVRRGDDLVAETQTCRWLLDDAPWISASFVQSMRESMAPARFAAEFECQFQAGIDSLFSKEMLDCATAPIVPGSLATLTGPARMFGGLDWGAVFDRTALVTIGRLVHTQADVPMFGVSLAHRWPEGYSIPDLVDEIASAPAHIARLTSEVNGIGQAASQILARALARRQPADGGRRGRNRHVLVEEGRPRARSPWDQRRQREFRTKLVAHTTSSRSKTAQFGALQMLLHRGQLVIPEADTELRRELLYLRVALTDSGGERVEAATTEGSGHDDLADALGMALGPYKHRDRWITHIGQFAEPDFPQPTPPPPLRRDVPMVATGGGLLVPRAPIWQSVAGDELSGPDDLHKPPPRTVGGFTITTGGLT
jgi:hypothetical protein